MRERRFQIAWIALATALVLAGNAAAEPLKIRVGWAVVPSQLTSIIFMKKDILKHEGTSYTFEPVKFRGSAPQITALAAGELDLAALAFSSVGLAIQNAHMDDIRVVADLYQDGIEGYRTSEYMVLADSPIQNIEDLKGKVLASNGIGGAIDMAIRKIMLDHGMQEKRDYRIVEVEFANMIPALREKKVDLVGEVTPFSIEAHKAGGVRTLFTLKQAMGPSEVTLLAARAPFIKEHRAALVDFFEDWIRATRWYLDPRNHEEAVKILADFTKKPASEFTDWVFTKEDYYRDPDAKPNLKALQDNLNVQKQLGLLDVEIDIGKYTDLSLIEDAGKRLQ
jgi:ABC-type nitrate/sulfonate/bicarbonate transport system substrate-binding protein